MNLPRPVAREQHPILSLICVDPARMDEVWPHVEKYFRQAYDKGIGDGNVDALKADVDAGRQRVWIIWDYEGDRLMAGIATKLIQTPTKKLCIITACGGEHMTRWIGLKVGLEDYARREGCDAIRLEGRRGWQSVFADYYQPWICLQKDLQKDMRG